MSTAARILSLAAAIALGMGAVRLVWLLGRPLALVVLAVTVAAAFAPAAARLDRHMPRGVAVVLVYLVLFGSLSAAAVLVMPQLARELDDLLAKAPEMLARLHSRLTHVLPAGREFQDAMAGAVRQLLGRAAALPLQMLSGAFELLVLVFLSLYLLIAGPSVQRFLASLVPPRRRGLASRLLCAIARAMGGYVRAVAIDGVIVGCLTWAALTAIGLPYALPLAVLAGAGELMPYVGPIVAAVPAVAVALTESTTQAVTVALLYLMLQQIESHVITPNIVHRQTDISPALVVFALAAGFAAGGVLGAIAAIPVAAAGRVVLLKLVAPAMRRATRSAGAAAAPMLAFGVLLVSASHGERGLPAGPAEDRVEVAEPGRSRPHLTSVPLRSLRAP